MFKRVNDITELCHAISERSLFICGPTTFPFYQNTLLFYQNTLFFLSLGSAGLYDTSWQWKTIMWALRDWRSGIKRSRTTF